MWESFERKWYIEEVDSVVLSMTITLKPIIIVLTIIDNASSISASLFCIRRPTHLTNSPRLSNWPFQPIWSPFRSPDSSERSPHSKTPFSYCCDGGLYVVNCCPRRVRVLKCQVCGDGELIEACGSGGSEVWNRVCRRRCFHLHFGDGMLEERDRLGDWIYAGDMGYVVGSNCDMEFKTIDKRPGINKQGVFRIKLKADDLVKKVIRQ